MTLQKTHFFSMINHLLNKLVQEKLTRRMDEIYTNLQEILTEDELEQVNLNELFNEYKYPVQLDLRPQSIKKQRVKTDIPNDERCFGRIGNKSRCSRRQVEHTDLCRIHNNSLPYGRIDGELDGKLIKMNKRRGRKSRANKEYKLEDLDHSKYVQAIVVVIDGNPYLMDENDILYEFNADNEIVGRQIDNEVHWE